MNQIFISRKPQHGQTELNVRLFAAVICDDIVLARQLLDQGADVEATNADGKSPLYLAAEKEETSWLELFLSAGARINRALNVSSGSALNCAIRTGRITSALWLLEHGADPRVQDNRRLTALHWLVLSVACRSAEAETEDSFKAEYELLQRLCRAVPVNQVDIDGDTALKIAVFEGARTRVVEILHEHGADPTICDGNGRGAMHLAWSSERLPRLQALIRLGADVDSRDASGRTALFWAADTEAIDAIIGAGADPNAIDYLGQNVLVSFLESVTPELKSQDGVSDAILQVLERLLYHGVDPDLSAYTDNSAAKIVEMIEGEAGELLRAQFASARARRAMRLAR